MPRPGPRPYECVRRAWHSERHQPMRGSLVKEIFRIAHEIHGLPTKKNKEWQEKLPIVVLKAEEIMYSKANSEAEYMDPKTLMERMNDAIDTIIRRDVDSETGELLQPCIEAALHLGCIPRRASRSQRNSDPRFYLGPYSLEKGETTLNKSSPIIAPQHPNFLNSTMLNSKLLGNSSQKRDFHSFNGDLNISYPPYPLYYGTYFPPESQPSFMSHPANMASFVSDKKFLEMGIMQNASPPHEKDSSTTITEEGRPEELGCDLSLRLAPFSGKNAAPTNVSLEKQKRLPLCPDLCLSSETRKRLPLCPDLCLSSKTRKRQAAEMEGEQQFSRQEKLLCKFSQEFQPPLKHGSFSFL